MRVIDVAGGSSSAAALRNAALQAANLNLIDTPYWIKEDKNKSDCFVPDLFVQ
jgi:hypothetical protein